jgi:hypothetical protein
MACSLRWASLSHWLLTLDCCLQVALELGEYAHVKMQFSKVELTSETPDKVLVTAKIKATQGLVYLHSGNFKASALSFLQTSPELGANYNDVSLCIFLFFAVFAYFFFSPSILRCSEAKLSMFNAFLVRSSFFKKGHLS